jgi:SAM-dependent methyltransferase
MQAWSAETYAHDAGFVPELGAGVLEWLAPTGGERILDLGCGDGILTDRIAQCSGGGAHTAAPAVPVDVVGVDSAQGTFVRSHASPILARPALGWTMHTVDHLDVDMELRAGSRL